MKKKERTECSAAKTKERREKKERKVEKKKEKKKKRRVKSKVAAGRSFNVCLITKMPLKTEF